MPPREIAPQRGTCWQQLNVLPRSCGRPPASLSQRPRHKTGLNQTTSSAKRRLRHRDHTMRTLQRQSLQFGSGTEPGA